eukprot:scaffold5569_cov116-Isochrysis_galbana.AAC.7
MCWSRTAALLCKYAVGQAGRSAEARALASKLERLHACGGRCHDALMAQAVGGAEGPVGMEARVDAPDCSLLDAHTWARMRDAEPLRRELQSSWRDEDLAKRAQGKG